MATAVTTPPKTVILAVPVVPDPPVSATLAYVPDIPPEPGVMAPSVPYHAIDARRRLETSLRVRDLSRLRQCFRRAKNGKEDHCYDEFQVRYPGGSR